MRRKLLFLIIVLFSSLAGFSQNIVYFEYYVDQDPGYNLATPLPVSAAPMSELNFTVPTGGLNSGIHIIGMRGRDDNANWSHDFIRIFYVDVIKSDDEPISYLEYFIDGDPGLGMATTINITPATVLDISFELNLNGLTPGFHFFGIRSKTENDVWSQTYTKLFLIDALDNQEERITYVEYFLDADPGMGNAMPVAITSGNVVELAFQVDMAGIATGFHFITVRSKTENDVWSQTYTKLFLIDALDNQEEPITYVEYFIDTDPGTGNATPVAITPGNVVDIAFQVDMTGIATGFHFIAVRSKTENNVWSQVYSKLFVVDAIANEESPVTYVEYYLDDDPGMGNATPVAITPGNVVNLAFDVDLNDAETGFHSFAIRAMDENENWSTTLFLLFYLDADQSVNDPNIVSLEYFVDEDPGFGSGFTVPINPPQPVADRNFVVNLGSLSPGEHLLYTRGKDENDNWSIVAVDTFNVEQGTEFALRFDGENDYLEAGDIPFPDNDLTIEAWIKPEEIVGYPEILYWYSENAGVQFRLQEDGSLLYGESANGNWSYVLSGAGMITTGQWTHIAITKQGDLCNLFINGIHAGFYQFDNDPITASLDFGGRGQDGDRFFNGDMDEVRIWNMARTQQEIIENLCANLTGNETGIYGLWHFNNGPASPVAIDSGPNGFGAWFYNMNPNTGPDCAWIDHSCNLPPATDLSVSAVNSPSELMRATASENIPVSIMIKNIGIEAYDGAITLGYQIQGSPAIFETSSLTLLTDQLTEFSFPETVNLSTPGMYELKVFIHPGSTQINRFRKRKFS